VISSCVELGVVGATLAVAQPQKAKGSAEEKNTDSAPKPAKIRPMREEMYCIYWNR